MIVGICQNKSECAKRSRKIPRDATSCEIKPNQAKDRQNKPKDAKVTGRGQGDRIPKWAITYQNGVEGRSHRPNCWGCTLYIPLLWVPGILWKFPFTVNGGERETFTFPSPGERRFSCRTTSDGETSRSWPLWAKVGRFVGKLPTQRHHMPRRHFSSRKVQRRGPLSGRDRERATWRQRLRHRPVPTGIYADPALIAT